MIAEILAQVIPSAKQRYETVGDWLYADEYNRLNVYSSDMGDWRMNVACIVHEIVEAALCVHADIPESVVSDFDRLYEEHRELTQIRTPLTPDQIGRYTSVTTELRARFGCGCVPTTDSEPGEDVHAPYRKQHAVADAIERAFAAAIDLPWAQYEEGALQACLDYEQAHGVEPQQEDSKQ